MLIGSMLLLINCDMAQAADTTSVSADSMLLFENEIDNLGKETDNKKEEKDQQYISDSTSDLRIGIAEVELQHYTKAIPVLQKALTATGNPIAANYLSTAYLMMNRKEEAKAIYNLLSEDYKQTYAIKPRPLSAIYAEGGLLLNNTDHPDNYAATEWYDFDPSGYGMILLTHDITPHLQLTHGVSYYRIGGSQTFSQTYGYDTTLTKENANTSFSHIGYTANLKATFIDNWQLTLAGCIFRTQAKYCTLEYDTTKIASDNTKYEWEDNHFYDNQFPPNPIKQITKNENQTNWIAELCVRKEWNIFGWEAGGSYGHIENKYIWQPRGQLEIYPFENLDFYSITSASGLLGDKNHLVWEESLGGRLCRWIWCTISYARGDMEYYHENELTNIYTMLYKTHYRISANITFPISKYLTVNVLYRYLKKESPSYHIATNNGQIEKESEETKSNNIIGGIKWTF